MADHAIQLMRAIQDVLEEHVPIAGGWHATRLDQPTFPVGYLDVTSSVPGLCSTKYVETHSGVVSVWSRKVINGIASPIEAFELSHAAHEALSAERMTMDGFTIRNLSIGPLRPANPDGITWGRTFTFTATTNED